MDESAVSNSPLLDIDDSSPVSEELLEWEPVPVRVWARLVPVRVWSEGSMELVVGFYLDCDLALTLQRGMASALQTVCGIWRQEIHRNGHSAEELSSFNSPWPSSSSCSTGSLALFYISLVNLKLCLREASSIYACGLIPPVHSLLSLLPNAEVSAGTKHCENPLAYMAVGVFLLHLLLSWIVVFALNYGLLGAALTLGFSWWILVVLTWLYILCSPSCKQSWTGLSGKAFRELWAYFKLTMASAVMLILWVWYNNGLVLLSGFLPIPEISLDAISICLNYFNLEFQVMLGISNAASIHVGNELGAGHPKVARFAVIIMVTTCTLISALILILSRATQRALHQQPRCHQ